MQLHSYIEPKHQLTSRKHLPDYMNMFVFFLQGSITSAACGVTKLCFSQPASCDPAANSKCYFMSAVALSPTAAAIRYEMTGPSDGYVSFGFSDDQMMVT